MMQFREKSEITSNWTNKVNINNNLIKHFYIAILIKRKHYAGYMKLFQTRNNNVQNKKDNYSSTVGKKQRLELFFF